MHRAYSGPKIMKNMIDKIKRKDIYCVRHEYLSDKPCIRLNNHVHVPKTTGESHYLHLALNQRFSSTVKFP